MPLAPPSASSVVDRPIISSGSSGSRRIEIGGGRRRRHSTPSRALPLARLLLLLGLLLATVTAAAGGKCNMRRAVHLAPRRRCQLQQLQQHGPAFVHASAWGRPRQQHQHPQQWQQQQQRRPFLQPMMGASTLFSTTDAGAAPEASAPAPQPPQPTPRERAHMAVAGFFPAEIKDNATAFFHVPPSPPQEDQDQAHPPTPTMTWPQAVAAALGLPMDRAEKLHEVGAIYAKRGGRFRRTRNFVKGGEDFGRFPREPAAPVEGELVRVHLFPRCVV